MATHQKAKAAPPRLTARKAPPASTVISREAPATVDESVALLPSDLTRHRRALLAGIKAECERDPKYLDLVLAELKPLRKRGRAAPASQDAIVTNVIRAMKGRKAGEIVESIAATLGLKDPSPTHSQARRLYDEVRKRKS